MEPVLWLGGYFAMSDSIHSDFRQDALLENFEQLHSRAEALGRSEAEEFARLLARCAQRMGLTPRKQSAL